MRKCIGLGWIVILVLSLFFAVPVTAAEIQVTVNPADQTMTIANVSAEKIYVLHLEGGETNVNVNADVPAGSSVVRAFNGELPANVTAVCLGGPDGIPGQALGLDGFYHLMVELL